MDNFTFCSPTEFIFGRDTQKEVGKALKRYGAEKVMIGMAAREFEKTVC